MSKIFQLGVMTTRKIDAKMDEMILGTTDTISHIDLVIKGKAPYN
jgi:hypothetical protein